MTVLHIPIVLTQNFSGSVRLLGIAGLLIMAFMWDSATMTHTEAAPEHKSCVVKRGKQKLGFHREVTTTVLIPENVLPNTEQNDNFKIFIKEHIPSGLYVDLDETKSAQEFGGPQVYSDVNIDVEKPEYMSPAHTVHVFTELTKTGRSYQSVVTLPIHLRYHKPSTEHSHQQIYLQSPDIYLNITDSPGDDKYELAEKYVCDTSGHTECLWKKLTCTFEPEDGPLEFSVPVGQVDDVTLVISVTLAITVFSTIFLAHSIISKKQKAVKED